jgi:hypothetical protein
MLELSLPYPAAYLLVGWAVVLVVTVVRATLHTEPLRAASPSEAWTGKWSPAASSVWVAPTGRRPWAGFGQGLLDSCRADYSARFNEAIHKIRR